MSVNNFMQRYRQLQRNNPNGFIREQNGRLNALSPNSSNSNENENEKPLNINRSKVRITKPRKNDLNIANNFKPGSNAIRITYFTNSNQSKQFNKYISENSLRKLSKKKLQNIYNLEPEKVVIKENPWTRKPVKRENINFVTFVKPILKKKKVIATTTFMRDRMKQKKKENTVKKALVSITKNLENKKLNPKSIKVPKTKKRQVQHVYTPNGIGRRTGWVNSNASNSNMSNSENSIPLPLTRERISINKTAMGSKFKIGNNAIRITFANNEGENNLQFISENQFRKLSRKKLRDIYNFEPEKVVLKYFPYSKEPIKRKNMKFVTFVKPNTPKTIRKKAGNAAQSRRTSQ